jgi:hypothetical protein
MSKYFSPLSNTMQPLLAADVSRLRYDAL